MLTIVSWSDEDGLHEGYVLPEFGDGVRGRGIWSGSVPADHVIVEVEYAGEPGTTPQERYTSRPAAEVVGWRVMCDCRANPSSSAITGTWMSDLVARVPSQSLEDLSAGRIFVSDHDVCGVDDTYFETFTSIWPDLAQSVRRYEAKPAVVRCPSLVECLPVALGVNVVHARFAARAPR